MKAVFNSLLSWNSHYESTPGLSNTCRTLPATCLLQTKPINLPVFRLLSSLSVVL